MKRCDSTICVHIKKTISGTSFRCTPGASSLVAFSVSVLSLQTQIIEDANAIAGVNTKAIYLSLNTREW